MGSFEEGWTGDESGERGEMGRKDIFFVNGSPDFLDVLRVLLQGEDYNVTTTNFVPRTFEQIAALRPGLLLVDLVVHRQAGWDLLEQLQC
jgi:DNA-binding NtrC family response regulator